MGERFILAEFPASRGRRIRTSGRTRVHVVSRHGVAGHTQRVTPWRRFPVVIPLPWKD